jgi:hypothetical protein
VNSDATQTYWSNDGTLVAGSTPANAIAVTVTNGLYSVALGENMFPIPPSVFSNADVRLRVWFDDGTANGEQLLSPDQRIAATGYAHTAAGLNLPDTSSSGKQGLIMQNGSRFTHNYGNRNFFAGRQAGNFSLTTGSGGAVDNVGVGFNTLPALTTGHRNVAIGSSALAANTTGIYNTAVGAFALRTNVISIYNTAIGTEALENNTGDGNTATGSQALAFNTDGAVNTANGLFALFSNTSGVGNTAMGYAALADNTGGIYNTAIGAGALGNAGGSYNVALGTDAGQNITSGGYNIAIGPSSGSALTNGSRNIAIGHTGVAAEANTIRLGTAANHTRTFIAGIRGVTTGASPAINVVIDSNGQLGTVSSSARYKEDVADMGDASARLQALRPVTFRYKRAYEDGEKPIQYGLIAEEVAQSFPELAVYDEDGEPETVRYQELAPLLLNEVQKLRREKDALAQEKDQLARDTEEMRARLDKLEALVTKSSDAR